VTAEVTATTPDDGCPGLTANAAHSKVVASRQVAALSPKLRRGVNGMPEG
jgi:hypothetical protein